MKNSVILLVYGEGGHKAQMSRLYALIKRKKTADIGFIGICENNHKIEEIENYSVFPLRDKYSKIKSFKYFFKNILEYIKICRYIDNKYNILGVISTGPGIAIPISIFMKIRRKKIIFIETWSRFYTKSKTGKYMYYISDKFYIQNKILKNIYPKAVYGGLL
ncbi:PssD/Cps14F family polysaccharide biosynthesis glycosyltransferase [Campylobacter hominis]